MYAEQQGDNGCRDHLLPSQQINEQKDKQSIQQVKEKVGQMIAKRTVALNGMIDCKRQGSKRMVIGVKPFIFSEDPDNIAG